VPANYSYIRKHKADIIKCLSSFSENKNSGRLLLVPLLKQELGNHFLEPAYQQEREYILFVGNRVFIKIFTWFFEVSSSLALLK